MSSSTLNLTAADFDAYLPERATSNAYSRPRIEVKQRAIAWGRRVVARLAEMGIALDVHGSDEHPSLWNKHRVDCQWVFFWRDLAAREELERLLDQGRPIAEAIEDPSPYTRHAFLALRIDSTAIEVCFAVHPQAKVDIDNLRARLSPADGQIDGVLTTEFTTALSRLPEQFTVGLGSAADQGSEAGPKSGERVPCSSVSAHAIIKMLERSEHVPFWIGWCVPRETAIAHAAILDEQLEDAIVALGPIYRLVAWSRENDHIALDRRLEGVEQERARTHAEIEAKTERWRAERALATEQSREQARARKSVREAAHVRPMDTAKQAQAVAARRKPTLGTLFGSKPAAVGGRAAGARPSTTEASTTGDSSQAHPASGCSSPMAESGSRDVASIHLVPGGVVDKGSRVRVRTGPFADKLGVVSELDGRGGARVLLGLLSTRLDVVDLEAVVDGRERPQPQLQSSHRRPAAPSPRKAR